MMLFSFNSQQELVAGVNSNLIPESVLQAPARAMVTEDGAIYIATESLLNKEWQTQLLELGLLVNQSSVLRNAIEVRHWFELIKPEKAGLGDQQINLVLFKLVDREQLFELSQELLRLGCDRQSFLKIDNTSAGMFTLLKAVSPPYYTVLKSLEQKAGFTLYLPANLGAQENLWLELGYQHPVISRHSVNSDQLTLINGCGDWQYFNSQPWQSIYQLAEFSIPIANKTGFSAAKPEKIPVPLRLVRQVREDSPSLWLIDEQPMEVMEKLISELPGQALSGLMFAVGVWSGRTVVILKLRPNWQQQTVYEVAGLACASLAGIDNLFLPSHALLNPPLQRQKMRELLAPDPDVITIVLESCADKNRVDICCVNYEAFYLLDDWVDYLVSRNQQQLQPWVKACSFDFQEFESIGMEWHELVLTDSSKKKPVKDKAVKADRNRVSNKSDPVKSYGHQQDTGGEDKEFIGLNWSADFAGRFEPGELDKKLASLEQEFMSLVLPADDPQRIKLWGRLAQCYTQAGKFSDAAQCFTRLLWHAESNEDISKWSDLWYQTEQGALAVDGNGTATIETLLMNKSDFSAPQLRAVVAGLMVGVTNIESAGVIKHWLDTNGSKLDVRSFWLANLQVSRLAGDDILQLVSARDLILSRLCKGLSLEQDVPAFIKFMGATQVNSVIVSRLHNELSQLFEFYKITERQGSELEAARELTDSYVYLVFAWGFACIHNTDRVTELTQCAKNVLGFTDPVHDCLTRLFEARISQALESLPGETPLEPRLLSGLEKLGRLERYKVDRLRQALEILEPHSNLDPFYTFSQFSEQTHKDKLDCLYVIENPRQLATQIDLFIEEAVAMADGDTEIARILIRLIDVLPRLGEVVALAKLQSILVLSKQQNAIGRCMVLEKALLLAGFYSQYSIVAAMVEEMDKLLSRIKEPDLIQVSQALARFIVNLRRVGLVKDGLYILEKVALHFNHKNTQTFEPRLQLACCFAELDQPKMLNEIFVEGEKRLSEKDLQLSQRLFLTRLLAQACSYIEQDAAFIKLQNLAGQLPMITDKLISNSHYCLSVVQFMESLILGYVSEQLLIGKSGRKWLGEDELLVRQRIQQDIQQLQ